MIKTMRANGTIVTSTFVIMDSSDNNSVKAPTAANQRVIGVAQEAGRTPPIPSETTDPPQAAQAGENVRVHCLGEEALLRIGSGGCTSGRTLKSDSSGYGVLVASTSNGRIGAIALETASQNELAKVQVVIYDQVANAS